MNCVTCNKPMVVLELQETEIDHCLACGGIWLDCGEIELMLGNSPETVRLLSQLSKTQGSQPSERKCPICLKKMTFIALGLSGDVIIDRCLKNHGLWFDRSELETVLTIFEANKHSAIHEILKSMFSEQPHFGKVD